VLSAIDDGREVQHAGDVELLARAGAYATRETGQHQHPSNPCRVIICKEGLGHARKGEVHNLASGDRGFDGDETVGKGAQELTEEPQAQQHARVLPPKLGSCTHAQPREEGPAAEAQHVGADHAPRVSLRQAHHGAEVIGVQDYNGVVHGQHEVHCQVQRPCRLLNRGPAHVLLQTKRNRHHHGKRNAHWQ